MKKGLLWIILAAAVLAGGYFGAWARPAKGMSGCTIDSMWTVNGADYLLGPPTVNTEQVQTTSTLAHVKYINCAGLTPYLVFFGPAFGKGGEKVGLGAMRGNNSDNTANLTQFTDTGIYYYIAYASGSSGTYQQKSNDLTVSQARCKVSLNFDATPHEVNSMSESISLNALVGESYPAADCNLGGFGSGIGIDVAVKFYGNGRYLDTRMATIMPQTTSTISIPTTAADIGAAPSSTANFKAIVTDQDGQGINLVSSPVYVGIGVPPSSSIGGGGGSGGGGSGGGGGGSGVTSLPPTTQSITLFNPLTGCNNLTCALSKVLNFLFTLAIPIFGIMILVGGFQLITSSGNPEKVAKGRKTLLWSVVGFIVVLLAGSVAHLIQSIFGG